MLGSARAEHLAAVAVHPLPADPFLTRTPDRSLETLSMKKLALAFGIALLSIAHAAIARTPQPHVFGPGSSPADEYQTNVTVMSICGGPISSGWGVNDGLGWRVAYRFTPSVTAAPITMGTVVSDNGAPTFTLNASIYTADAFGHPQTLLYQTASITWVNAPVYPMGAKVKFPVQGAPVLTAGTDYVLVIRSPAGGCLVDANPGTCVGLLSQSLDGGITWNNQAGSMIHGIAAP